MASQRRCKYLVQGRDNIYFVKISSLRHPHSSPQSVLGITLYDTICQCVLVRSVMGATLYDAICQLLVAIRMLGVTLYDTACQFRLAWSVLGVAFLDTVCQLVSYLWHNPVMLWKCLSHARKVSGHVYGCRMHVLHLFTIFNWPF